jgi:hypothetical protein
MLSRERQHRAGRRRDFSASVLQVGAHDRRVDHVRRGEVAAGGQDGLADFDGALSHRLFLDDDAAFRLMAPATPVPMASVEFAALIIASTSQSVMSPRSIAMDD